ncbi:MAG: hypothetical protein WCG22_06750 [Lentisphaerota bacterium]
MDMTLEEQERVAYALGDTTTAQLLGQLIEAEAKLVVAAEKYDRAQGELDELRAGMRDVSRAINGIKEVLDGF